MSEPTVPNWVQSRVDVAVGAHIRRRRVLMVALLVATAVVATGVQVVLANGACGTMLGPLNVFCDGEPAVAAKVNSNWSAIKTFHESRLGEMKPKQLTSSGATFNGNGSKLTNLAGKNVQSSTVDALVLPQLMLLGVPTGTIAPHTAETPPPGWLSCDGNTLSSTEPANKALFQVIGTSFGTQGTGAFKLPDLRGVFLRGVNGKRKDWRYGDLNLEMDYLNKYRKASAAGGATGNNVGSSQADGFMSHFHMYKLSLITTGDDGSTQNYERFNRHSAQTSENGLGEESRPRNLAVHYIIKR